MVAVVVAVVMTTAMETKTAVLPVTSTPLSRVVVVVVAVAVVVVRVVAAEDEVVADEAVAGEEAVAEDVEEVVVAELPSEGGKDLGRVDGNLLARRMSLLAFHSRLGDCIW